MKQHANQKEHRDYEDLENISKYREAEAKKEYDQFMSDSATDKAQKNKDIDDRTATSCGMG